MLRSGDPKRAVAELLALARDPRRSRTPRRRAYRAAAEALQAADEHGELEPVAAEWLAFAPEDVDAGWLRLHALVRRTLVERALELWRERELPVQTEQQALLLAQVFALAAAPEEALAEIAELSDRFGRSERLEFALATTSLRHEGAQLADDLAARIREAFESFPARFPESTLMQAFEIDPEDAARSFADRLREQQGDRARLLRGLSSQVAEGSVAVAFLAGGAGRGVGETWLRLEALPLGLWRRGAG